MNSLRTRQGNGGKASRLTVLDLDHPLGDDEGKEGDPEQMIRENMWMKKLVAEHTKCRMCGPNKWCITPTETQAKHVCMDNGQKRAWVVALVCPHLFE